MDRLTNNKWRNQHYTNILFGNNYQRAFERLAAYEDTGFEPEEIVALKHSAEITRKACQPMLQAESEDRLIILPCKVDDEIYRIEKGKVAAHIIEKIELHRCGVTLCFGWKNCGYECVDTKCVGKSVFLTREEAKASLEGET